jgi:transposase-like protein
LSQTASLLDQEPEFTWIKEAIENGETNASIAKEHDVSEASIRRFRRRHGLNPRSFDRVETVIDGDEGYIVTAPSTVPVLQDPDTMIRQRGLDPEEWRIADGMRVNQYEGPAPKGSDDPKITYYQTRFNIERRNPQAQIFAPRTDGWIAPPKAPIFRDLPQLVVIVGDQQAPFHDKGLHECFLAWLEENEPHRGVSLGDTFDFPDIRPGHRVYPDHNATVTECLQSGYDLFRGYIESSPDTHWEKLIGNHDERIVNILLDKPLTRPMAEIRRPVDEDGGGELLHALSHAARLDELGVKVHETGGSYEHGQVNLSKYLAVRHGWIARKGAGNSALATLEATRYSVIVGHTHRQSIVHHTSANIDGHINTLAAAEAGCMCRIEQIPDPDDGRMWPGYTVSPDWQQGFITATIWPDGKFHLDPATYVDGTLLWRDQRYAA